MDFVLRPLPEVDDTLALYRDGRIVGRVKVTGPSRETTIAGDITAGEAVVGDEVRAD
jgi:hypothetical protein